MVENDGKYKYNRLGSSYISEQGIVGEPTR